jgi:hypothetical protein
MEVQVHFMSRAISYLIAGRRRMKYAVPRRAMMAVLMVDTRIHEEDGSDKVMAAIRKISTQPIRGHHASPHLPMPIPAAGAIIRGKPVQ